mmetsp:Transcript_5362/g.16563  ORF Transcript_5362/g.16563 Transcript_5362/m.16563 type:complete len:205 (+) Transcript_5362:804-1418(+)
MISALAFFTASAVPAILTWQGSVVWSRASTLKAPLFSRISMIVCACLPMTLPRRAFGTGTVSSTAGSRKMGMSSGGGSSRRTSTSPALGAPWSLPPPWPAPPPLLPSECCDAAGAGGCQPAAAAACSICGPAQGHMGQPPMGPVIGPPDMPGQRAPCQPRRQTSCRQSEASELEDEEDERLLLAFFFLLRRRSSSPSCCWAKSQ